MKIITFINKKKANIEKASTYLEKIGLEVAFYPDNLILPKTDNLIEEASSIVRQVYEKINEPCFTICTGFYINALNGFPKTNINFVLETIGIDGILKLMQNISNRECFYRNCLAYYDGKEIKYFFNENHGTIARQPAKVNNITNFQNLGYIFIPSDYDKTMAELTTTEYREIEKNKDILLVEFVEWLDENNI